MKTNKEILSYLRDDTPLYIREHLEYYYDRNINIFEIFAISTIKSDKSSVKSYVEDNPDWFDEIDDDSDLDIIGHIEFQLKYKTIYYVEYYKEVLNYLKLQRFLNENN